jgi:hypothetical protein
MLSARSARGRVSRVTFVFAPRLLDIDFLPCSGWPRQGHRVSRFRASGKNMEIRRTRLHWVSADRKTSQNPLASRHGPVFTAMRVSSAAPYRSAAFTKVVYDV